MAGPKKGNWICFESYFEYLKLVVHAKRGGPDGGRTRYLFHAMEVCKPGTPQAHSKRKYIVFSI